MASYNSHDGGGGMGEQGSSSTRTPSGLEDVNEELQAGSSVSTPQDSTEEYTNSGSSDSEVGILSAELQAGFAKQPFTTQRAPRALPLPQTWSGTSSDPGYGSWRLLWWSGGAHKANALQASVRYLTLFRLKSNRP